MLRFTLKPLPYALAAVAVGLAQHGALLVLMGDVVGRLPLHTEGLISLLGREHGATLVLVAFAIGGVAQALLAAMRVRDAKANNALWTVLPALIPVVQIPVILGLIALPSADSAAQGGETSAGAARLNDAGLALAAAVAGSVLSIVFGALVFGSYGLVLFLFSPFLVGYAAGLIANRTRDAGFGLTLGVVALGLALGGVGLLFLALEGVICLVMASPLAFILGGLGGEVGRRVAVQARRTPEQALSSLMLLPLLFAMEQLTPSMTAFQTEHRIFIAAPPAAVWQAMVALEPMADAPRFPLNLGLAYPVSATWDARGPGAIRRSQFSTGVAVERVTEWRPGEALTLRLLTQPPAMRELSPYGHVFAPHVQGYFRHVSSRFTLTPAPGGAWLTLTGRHEMDLAPGPYWRPIARWVIDADARRGMAHIKAQAERR